MGNKEKTRLILLRHGEVENAAERTFNGHYDVDISEEGVRQFNLIASKFKDAPIKAIYSSDLRRASRGAHMIAEYHSLPVIEYKEFREINYGIWEGMKVEEVLKLQRAAMVKRYLDLPNYRIQDGETLVEMHNRVIPMAEKLLKSHHGDTILLVAHGGVNRLFLLWALNCDLTNFYRIQQDYAALNIINYYSNGQMDVELMNSTP